MVMMDLTAHILSLYSELDSWPMGKARPLTFTLCLIIVWEPREPSNLWSPGRLAQSPGSPEPRSPEPRAQGAQTMNCNFAFPWTIIMQILMAQLQNLITGKKNWGFD